MFVILEWRIGRIVGVFNRHDSRLLTLFEKCNEYFRNGFITNNYFPTSMQHCFYPKLMHERLKQNWVADEGQGKKAYKKMSRQIFWLRNFGKKLMPSENS
jgi:hypothetical protein